jgi:hypothetical protein
MRIMIVRTFHAGSQTLNAGVLCDPADELARDWIAQGFARAFDPAQADDQCEADQPPETQTARARRAKG